MAEDDVSWSSATDGTVKLAALVDEVTGETIWEGVFGPPVPSALERLDLSGGTIRVTLT